MLERFDLPIQRFLSGYVGRSAHFDQFVYALSSTDTIKGILMMSLMWFAWFHRPRNETAIREKERQIHLLIVMAGSVATVILSRILQLGLRVHQRPLLAGLGLHFPAGIDMSTVNRWNSFPSDHAMLFFALGTGLWQVNRWMGWFAYLWATFVICLPRVYLGIHYPSDVVAGAILGVLCMLGFERLPVRNLAGRVHASSRLHPGLFYWCAFLFTEQTGHLYDEIRNMASLLMKFVRS